MRACPTVYLATAWAALVMCLAAVAAAAAAPLLLKDGAESMGVYEAWHAAAEAVFGEDAAAAAAAADAVPKSLVTPSEPGAYVTAVPIPDPVLDAADGAAAGAAPKVAAFQPGGYWYRVSWGVNASNVLPSDRLAAIWEPPAGVSNDTAVTDRDPLQFAFVSVLAPSTYNTSGNGSALAWLPPMRQAVRFAYVRQGPFTLWANATSVASATVQPPSPNAPMAVKVTGGLGGGGDADPASLVAAPSAVAVTWQTRDIMVGGFVRWGPSGGPLSFTANATSGDGLGADGTVFNAATGYCTGIGKPATLEGAPWNFESLGAVNRAVLVGLAPGTAYEFEVVAGEARTGGSPDDGSSATVAGAFTTPPAAADAGAATRLILLADGGTTLPDGWDQSDGNLQLLYKQLVPAALLTPGSDLFAAFQGALALAGGQAIQPAAGTVTAAVTARLAAGAAGGAPYHGVLFTGDISYARGEAVQWDVWSAAWGPALRAAPVLAAAGNHESCGPPIANPLIVSTPPPIDDGGECGQAYARLLGAPTPSGAGSWWYASRSGPLTVLHLNSDQSLAPGTPQGDWFAGAVAGVDRGATPWLAVAIHRPLYSDDPTTDQQGPSSTLVADIERLLVMYSVDLVISGHLHTYQRSCPVAKGNCFPASPCAAVAAATGLDAVAALKCKVKEALAAKIDGLKDDARTLWSGVGSAGAVMALGATLDAKAAGLARRLPPPGVVPPTHILLGNAGFRNPLWAFARRPAWLAAQARTYGLGELEVTRTRLALTVTSPDGGATYDTLALAKPARWRPPSPAVAGAWYDALGAAPAPEAVSPGAAQTLALLLEGVRTRDPALLAYYQPGTPAYELAHRPVSGPDGEAWPPQDVWTAAAPAIRYCSLNGTGPLPGPNYAYALVRGPADPGRLYYGNGTDTGVAGPTGLPV